MTELDRRAPAATHSLFAVVGFLVCVEVASGVLQGYYTPIFSDIADHLGIADADVNWFEAAQLVVSALVVPPLASSTHTRKPTIARRPGTGLIGCPVAVLLPGIVM